MYSRNVLFFLIAKLGPITKGLLLLVEKDNVDTLKAQTCRDTPTLLDYIPSYKGVLRKRPRKKMTEGGEEPASTSRVEKRKRAPRALRVRQLTNRNSASYWFGLNQEEDKLVIPGYHVPLRAVDLSLDEEMAHQRNVVRPNIRDETPTVRAGVSSSTHQEKRQKTTHDSPTQVSSEVQASRTNQRAAPSTTSGSTPIVNREDVQP